MPALEFELTGKHLHIEAGEGGFKMTLSFGIRMPKRESLRTVAGEDIQDGYIEFTEERPRFPKPELHFTEGWLDKDTNEIIRPSISFYADLPTQLFTLLRDLKSSVKIRLRINAGDFVGSIRYGDDHDGYEKIWDTAMENPVFPVSFKLEFVYPDDNDT